MYMAILVRYLDTIHIHDILLLMDDLLLALKAVLVFEYSIGKSLKTKE